jgi:asparagine synthase (glutamine-hydrolysing)
LHTFSIGDDPTSADLAVGRRLAACLGTDHHEIALDPEALVESLPRSLWALESPTEPSIVESAAPAIRRHVKAALCGDGADELFAGYAMHVAPERWLATCADRYNRLVRTGEVRVGECASSKEAIGARVGLDPAALRESVYRFFLEGQLVDAHLLVWDRGSMASGLEVRVPYLDRSVRDLALALPWDCRIRGRRSKVLLREVARRELPEAIAAEVVTRPKLAAPSAVQRTFEAIERAAREIVPAARTGHPLRAFCATPGNELLVDLFALIFVGRGGAAPEGVRVRELYTTHREELESAIAAAAG